MQKPRAAASLLPAIELETRPHPSHAVIWLHGLGADGNDFVPIVSALPLPPLAIRFVFPHAPMIPVTINGGFVMRAWYDILQADLGARQDEHGIRESQKAIEALIEREVERGIPASRIVLAGFSQGGVMTLHTGLRYRRKLAGLIALSAYLPLADRLAKERSGDNAGVSIFLAHGSADPIIPVAAGQASSKQLAKLGYQVEWHEYAMPHSVCEQEIGDIGMWLQRVLL
jgi:phospholipase/carboxylesterase